MQTLIDRIKAARLVGVPMIAVTTPDQPALCAGIVQAINGGTPIVSWDRARGLLALNKAGQVSLQALGLDANALPIVTSELAPAMRSAINLPEQTILIAFSVDRFLRESSEAVQAIANLRDAYKANKRTLVMMSPDFKLPVELRHDVILVDDPLPGDEGYRAIAQDLYESAQLVKTKKDGSYESIDDETASKATLAVRGLSAFEAEQVLAMSLALNKKGHGFDFNAAWELKRNTINSVKGLTMSLDGPALRDLRGQDSIIEMLDQLFAGPERPELIVRVDEIDKGLAGLGSGGGPGDNTGVSQDLNQQFLTNMEDNGWDGVVLVGVRGSGKTVLTQSIGADKGIPTIAMDTGAMKGIHVGESEAAFREAFRTFKSIAGSRVFVMATCNKMDVLPPELLRRFKINVWYFDVLTAEERDALWPVYLKKYGHKLDSERPNDVGWTGAEIRNCCELAYKFASTPAVVGPKYIIPVTKSDPQSVESLRVSAMNRFLSAAYPGTYQGPPPAEVLPTTKRKLTLGKES